MIGAIAGDIIGSAYEWDNIKSKEFELFSTRSKFTDDTVLTVAVADCILNNRDYAKTFKEYGRRYPHAGYGGNFNTWLHSDSLAPYNSFGNGSPCGSARPASPSTPWTGCYPKQSAAPW